MIQPTIIGAHGTEFRIGPWHGMDDVAYITMARSDARPDTQGVVQCLRSLRELGVRRVVTNALRSPETIAFLSAGFSPVDELDILRRDLRTGEGPIVEKPTRARRGDHHEILAVDAAAFEPFWQLDQFALDEALSATPSARFRCIRRRGIVAYSICGRAGRTGYLQRLAVHPDHTRQGLATTLVNDAVRWLRRRRATSMLVNTQVTNDAALRMYEQLGFVLTGEQLLVLDYSW